MNIKLAAIAAACTFTFPIAAFAQQAAAAPAKPPAWQQGKSDEFKDSKLAPNPGRNTETPASEIAVDKLKVPKGFKIELWASGMPGARAMVRGDKGKIYIGTRGLGRVYEITDADIKALAHFLAHGG